MTNKRGEKVARRKSCATVSDPPATSQEATANQHLTTQPVRPPSPQDTTTETRTDRILKGDPMTTNRPTARDLYVTTYHAELGRLLSKQHISNGHDFNDIISFGIIRLLKNYEKIVVKDPDPILFARRSAKNLARDYHRRQAAQRGEGARNERQVGSLDLGTSPDSLGGVVPDFADDYLDERDRAELIDKISAVLPQDQLEVLWEVDGLGKSVKQFANEHGVRRETISRTASKARTAARKLRGPAS